MNISHSPILTSLPTLGVTGFCDLLEVHPDGRLVPVEYKQGRQGQWANDEAQLCAQALCLEEMTASTARPPIEYGALFYFGSRRRVEVHFTPQLRAMTHSLIAGMRHLLAGETIPPHTEHRQRCRGCSLHDICLPDETAQLQLSP
jgi:CRISPR-associated exonuclease Cas4